MWEIMDKQQIEPVIITRCNRCGNDICEGNDLLVAEDYDYCSWHCYREQTLIDGVIKETVAGLE